MLSLPRPPCPQCLVNILRDVIKYINSYAYVFVAVYNKPFLESGKSVMDLFQRRGWDALLNDIVIDRALSLGCFVVASISAVGGAGVGFLITAEASKDT